MLNSTSSCALNGTNESQLHVSLSTFWYCFLAFITALGLLVALVSNMIIIYLFTKTPYLRRNPTNIIAVNLSLSDLLYCAQWPSVIYCSLTQSTWILEIDFVCQTFGFLTVSTALASIYTVLAMSIERAIVISCSIHAKGGCFSIRAAWSIVVLIWIVSICSCLPPLFGKFNRYTLDPSKTSCTLDYLSDNANYKLYILALYIAFWIAPAALITICYALIIVAFKRSSRSLKLASGNIQQQQSRQTISSPTSTRSTTSNEQDNEQSANNQQVAAFNFSSALATRRRRRLRLRDSIKSVRFVSSPAQQLARRLTTPAIMQRSGQLLARVPSSRCPINRPTAPCDTTRVAPVLDATLPLPGGGGGGGGGGVDVTHNQSTPQLRLASTTSSASTINTSSGATANAANVCYIGTSSSQHSRTGIQIRLAKMSFYLILLWFVSWTPIASLALINSILHCHRRPSALAVFLANTMTKLGPTFDVFIYGISHPKIKSKFKQIIKWLLVIGRTSSQTTTLDNDIELPVQSMFRGSIRSQASRT